jgi:hypothetical protein
MAETTDGTVLNLGNIPASTALSENSQLGLLKPWQMVEDEEWGDPARLHSVHAFTGN